MPDDPLHSLLSILLIDSGPRGPPLAASSAADQDGPAGRRVHEAGSVPQRGVQMVRDPICGTFVVPERAVALSHRGDDRSISVRPIVATSTGRGLKPIPLPRRRTA